MIVGIHQPNFMPWLGFFHKLIKSDVFVLFDDVQLPRGSSFCSRVAIKYRDESRWLTIPVTGKSSLVTIKDAQMVADQPWRKKHIKTLKNAYEKAPYFLNYYESIEKLYQRETTSLLEFNKGFIKLFTDLLGAKTRLVYSSDLHLGHLTGTQRLLAIVEALGAKFYLAGEGQGTKRYLDEDLFKERGIEVIYQQFKHPVYGQLGKGFIPYLSIIDLLFNHGSRTREFILG